MSEVITQAWASWQVEPLAADASARRYDRLIGPEGETVIRMNSGRIPTGPFVDMARALTQLGLTAPQVLQNTPPILILSDLGRTDMATALSAGADPLTLYRAAVDILIHIHHAASPPLAEMDPQTGGDMVQEVIGLYAPDADAAALGKSITDHLHRLTSGPLTLSLRDFHVENLIWRPNEAGFARVGLLDFQDAFLAPTGYDLASLLRDVRRDVPADVAQALTAHFCVKTGLNPDPFGAQLAILGAQRNLRILGVFARLIRQHNKPKYRQFMPRVWRHICADLAHPALSQLRDIVLADVPPPETMGLT